MLQLLVCTHVESMMQKEFIVKKSSGMCGLGFPVFERVFPGVFPHAKYTRIYIYKLIIP